MNSNKKACALRIFAMRRQKMLFDMKEMLQLTKKEKAPLPSEYEELDMVINKLISYETKFLTDS